MGTCPSLDKPFQKNQKITPHFFKGHPWKLLGHIKYLSIYLTLIVTNAMFLNRGIHDHSLWSICRHVPPAKGSVHDTLATQGSRLRRSVGGSSEGWSGQAEGFSHCKVAGAVGRATRVLPHQCPQTLKRQKHQFMEKPTVPLAICLHSPIVAIRLLSSRH